MRDDARIVSDAFTWNASEQQVLVSYFLLINSTFYVDGRLVNII